MREISIGAILKNPEMLRLAPDYFKAKNMCKRAVKKLPFLIRNVPDRYKNQKMCGNAILENLWLGVININNVKHLKKS